MSSTAPLPLFEHQPKARVRQTNGAHERMERAVEIRVIPGGLMPEQARPRHARAGLLEGMQGAPFGLSSRELACAGMFGTLFAFAAFAAALM